MARPNLITQYMNAELPCISEQKRLPFRPSESEVDALYRAINRCIFSNSLTKPTIAIGSIKKAWGRCQWFGTRQRRSSWGKAGTWCHIDLMDKWISPQWFCTTLAHEMVHQWQWDVYRWHHLAHLGRDMYTDSGAHGPSFYAWKEPMAEWGIPLKISHGQRRWYRHQDLFKC